jgi:hypothetical protein
MTYESVARNCSGRHMSYRFLATARREVAQVKGAELAALREVALATSALEDTGLTRLIRRAPVKLCQMCFSCDNQRR